MPIDPRLVAWDKEPQIDEKMVAWDNPTSQKLTPKEQSSGLTDFIAEKFSDLGGYPIAIANAILQGKDVKQEVRDKFLKDTQKRVNMAGGAIRGVGSTGNVIVSATEGAQGDKRPFKQRLTERGQAMDLGLQNLIGSNPNAQEYGGTKFLTEMGIGYGAGGAVGRGGISLLNAANLSQKYPTLLRALTAMETGGATTGVTPQGFKAGLGDLALRSGGGAANAAVGAATSDPTESEMSAYIGGAMPILGKALSGTGDVVKNYLGSERLMRSALKPTPEMIEKGMDTKAIKTALENGVNVSMGGLEKVQSRVDVLNQKIDDIIKNSNGKVNKNDVAKVVDEAKTMILEQVDAIDDLDKLNVVKQNFLNHPFFQQNKETQAQLKEVLDRAIKGKKMAMDAYGEMYTTAAQQKNLGQGKSIRLSPKQTENTSYFNVGGLDKSRLALAQSLRSDAAKAKLAETVYPSHFNPVGGDALSPSAYKVPFMPRVPYKYTPHADVVKGNLEGAEYALSRAREKLAEENAARLAYESFNPDELTIQQAQKMKKGTYKMLRDKYGQVGTAEETTQKALARGLKQEIEKIAPEVKPINAEESDLLNLREVLQRRLYQTMGNNPIGSRFIPTSPSTFATWAFDKSDLLKSLAARGIYNTNNALQPALGLLPDSETLYRTLPIYPAIGNE